jgi:hypothetical protein
MTRRPGASLPPLRRARLAGLPLLLALLVAPAAAAERGARLNEDQTAAYIIGKILDNFQYRGRTKLATWTIDRPEIVYQHPYLDISMLKRMFPRDGLPEDYGMRFRIDVRKTRTLAIETGVLRVACMADCVEVESNGQTGRYPYFWINAIAIDNPADAARVNRAFVRLQNLAGLAREPFD